MSDESDVGWDEIQRSWLIPDGQPGGLCRTCARIIPVNGKCRHGATPTEEPT